MRESECVMLMLMLMLMLIARVSCTPCAGIKFKLGKNFAPKSPTLEPTAGASKRAVENISPSISRKCKRMVWLRSRRSPTLQSTGLFSNCSTFKHVHVTSTFKHVHVTSSRSLLSSSASKKASHSPTGSPGLSPPNNAHNITVIPFLLMPCVLYPKPLMSTVQMPSPSPRVA